MDPYSIFINDLPKNLTYGEIKGAFWPYQTTPALQICKKEKYLIITFQKEDAVQQIIEDKDHITIKGKPVSIKQSYSRHIHLPPSFRLPIEVLFPNATTTPSTCTANSTSTSTTYTATSTSTSSLQTSLP